MFKTECPYESLPFSWHQSDGRGLRVCLAQSPLADQVSSIKKPTEEKSYSLRQEPAIALSHLLQLKKNNWRHRKLVGGDEIVLDLDCGGIYTAICFCENSQSYTIDRVHFAICYLNLNF